MAKRFNVDEQTQLAEPIEVVIEGKTYTLEKITVNLMDKVVEIGKDTGTSAPIKQLSLLLNTTEEEFKNVDVRKIAKVLEFITETIKTGIDSKNPTIAEAK